MTAPTPERRVGEARVAEWAALADAATPGPWFSDDAKATPGDVSLWHGSNGPWLGEIVVNLGGSFVEVGVACENEIANARFIAAAREAVPALAAEVSRLTAEVARLTKNVESAYREGYAKAKSLSIRGTYVPIGDPWEESKSRAALSLPTPAPEATE